MPNNPSEQPIVPQGPGFGLTFLYYFSGTALVTTFLAIKTLHVSLETGIPSQFGLAFGLIAGVLGAYVNQTRTLEIPYKNRAGFLKRVETQLENLGYHEDLERSNGVKIYTRPPLRQLFSGRIYLQLANNKATFSSRATHIRALKKHLERTNKIEA